MLLLLLLLLLVLLALLLLLLFTKTTARAVPKATVMTVKRKMIPYCIIFGFIWFSHFWFFCTLPPVDISTLLLSSKSMGAILAEVSHSFNTVIYFLGRVFYSILTN